MSALAIEQATISTLATGGVCWPMARLSVTIRPKWIGSMPTGSHQRHHDRDDEDDRRRRVQEHAEDQEEHVEQQQHQVRLVVMVRRSPAASCCGSCAFGEVDADQRARSRPAASPPRSGSPPSMHRLIEHSRLEVAVNDMPIEQRRDHRERGAFGCGDDAAENAAEDDDRQDQRPGRFSRRLRQPAQVEALFDREIVFPGVIVSTAPSARARRCTPGMMPATNIFTTDSSAMAA